LVPVVWSLVILACRLSSATTNFCLFLSVQLCICDRGMYVYVGFVNL